MTALRAAGIDPILLKGRTLEELLPPEQRPRTYLDSDLLVPAPERGRTEAVLTGLGFSQLLRAGETPGGEDTSMHWTREADRSNLDLHVELSGARAAPARQWELLSPRTGQIEIAGLSVRCLDDAGRALLVALHAAQHGNQFDGPVRDLTAALTCVDLATWRAARELAVALDALGAMGAGLRTLPAGTQLADALDLHESADTETLLRAAGAPPLTLGVEAFASARGPRAKARLLTKKLFPSPAFMRLWSPLANRGPLGLAIAYLWRPIWLLLRLPRALIVWGRTRAER